MNKEKCVYSSGEKLPIWFPFHGKVEKMQLDVEVSPPANNLQMGNKGIKSYKD